MFRKRTCFIFLVLFISLMTLSIPQAQSQERSYDSLLDQSIIAYGGGRLAPPAERQQPTIFGYFRRMAGFAIHEKFLV